MKYEIRQFLNSEIKSALLWSYTSINKEVSLPSFFKSLREFSETFLKINEQKIKYGPNSFYYVTVSHEQRTLFYILPL